jgi:hypothetical protein
MNVNMPSKTGKTGHYNDMPGKFYGPEPTDTSGRGAKAPSPHPNGGECRQVDRAGTESKMPRNQKSARITHGPLAVENGKMPRSMSGGRERDPFRR